MPLPPLAFGIGGSCGGTWYAELFEALSRSTLGSDASNASSSKSTCGLVALAPFLSLPQPLPTRGECVTRKYAQNAIAVWLPVRAVFLRKFGLDTPALLFSLGPKTLRRTARRALRRSNPEGN